MADERGLENPALHKWYSYNWTTHIVKSKHHTYALRSATAETVLLTFLSCYCDDGSPGCVTFQYVNPVEAQGPAIADRIHRPYMPGDLNWGQMSPEEGPNGSLRSSS